MMISSSKNFTIRFCCLSSAVVSVCLETLVAFVSPVSVSTLPYFVPIELRCYAALINPLPSTILKIRILTAHIFACVSIRADFSLDGK